MTSCTFDDCEDAYEFRVDNGMDLVCAMREMRVLDALGSVRVRA